MKWTIWTGGSIPAGWSDLSKLIFESEIRHFAPAETP